MKTKQILKELHAYLGDYFINRLSMGLVDKGSISFCLVIEEIIKGYNSTNEDEDKVCLLLARLCKIHFQTPAV